MPSIDVKNYQKEILDQFKKLFPNTPSQNEWPAFHTNGIKYSPRVDIVVGPYSTENRCIDEYDNLMDTSRIFIESIIHAHLNNIDGGNNDLDISRLNFNTLKNHNYNARCFIAVEIENQVSRKHLIGSAINAAALGRIGIIVGWTEEKFKSLLRLKNYLKFLTQAEKPSFQTTNLLILKPEQLRDSLLSANRQKMRNST